MGKYGLSGKYPVSSKVRMPDSLNCTLVGGLFFEPITSIVVVDTLAYTASGPCLEIFNVKDSANPVEIYLFREFPIPHIGTHYYYWGFLIDFPNFFQ